jgi:hypothetical protein
MYLLPELWKGLLFFPESRRRSPLDIPFGCPGRTVKSISLSITLQFVGGVVDFVIKFALFDPAFQLPVIVIDFPLLKVTF